MDDHLITNIISKGLDSFNDFIKNGGKLDYSLLEKILNSNAINHYNLKYIIQIFINNGVKIDSNILSILCTTYEFKLFDDIFIRVLIDNITLDIKDLHQICKFRNLGMASFERAIEKVKPDLRCLINICEYNCNNQIIRKIISLGVCPDNKALLMACRNWRNNEIPINDILNTGVKPDIKCLEHCCYCNIGVVERIINSGVEPNSNCLTLLIKNLIEISLYDSKNIIILFNKIIDMGIKPNKETLDWLCQIVSFILPKNYTDYAEKLDQIKNLIRITLDNDIIPEEKDIIYVGKSNEHLDILKLLLKYNPKLSSNVYKELINCNGNINCLKELVKYGVQMDDQIMSNLLEYHLDSRKIKFVFRSFKPTIEWLESACKGCTPSVIEEIVKAGILPNLKCLNNVLDRSYESTCMMFIDLIRSNKLIDEYPDITLFKKMCKIMIGYKNIDIMKMLKETIELFNPNDTLKPGVLDEEWLKLACSYLPFKMVDKILSYGVIPNEKCLRASCKNNDLTIFDKLLEYNLSPNKDCLIIACKNSNVGMIDKLMDFNLNPDIDCLLAACQKGYTKVINKLLDANIEPNIECLIIVCKLGLCDIALKMMDSGLEPNSTCFQYICDFYKNYKKY